MATSVVGMGIEHVTGRGDGVESGDVEVSGGVAGSREVEVVEREEDGDAVIPRISDVRRNVGESVDRLLDESHSYRAAVRAAFEQFQLPRPAVELPLSQLLPALQFFIQRLCDSLDPKCGKLVLRPITHEDIRGSIRSNPSLSLQPLLTLQQFEGFARETLKRVALDRSKRLGLFLIGGIFAVHMAKNAVKNIPILGGPIGAFVNVLVPTSLLGPAVGIAGALYL
ncbi:hypothetical protein KC19_12G053200 [Ceratodon purpureus]|uniref:Uncharacterized protein n=1 Tax=Ceratodon purpureus TaxID=3225 RepID=A0A8T0G694_CERPU|nr:hypothetical protein KC19_12G053200 [Ceratodon purpureus]